MFAGIGGFRSGLSHYGDFFVPVGYCEIDPYAKRAYEAIYLDLLLLADEQEDKIPACQVHYNSKEQA